jgi:hypothetical protein
MLKSLARRFPRWLLLMLAAVWLEREALAAFGGRENLWLFQKWEHHRYTAMAMLSGTLRLRHGLSKLGPDEQVFNGASYDNWGFGIPLLQVPFHLFARLRGWSERFFPDRAIFFVYLALFVPVLWAGFDRLLAMRERPGSFALRRHTLSWAATWLVLTLALYPLMSCRFLIYEESVSYFIIAELAAVSAYVFVVSSTSRLALSLLGLAAGAGLLIRSTGLVYLGAWTVLVLLERRKFRDWGFLAAGAAPAVVFWLYSNWVKTGSPVGLGYVNTLPWIDAQTPMVRFGSLCADTPAHVIRIARTFLREFFLTSGEIDNPWLEKCHFVLEERPTSDPHEPLLGMGVLVLLAWMLLHQLAARERRLALYAPYAVMALVFGSYVWAGAGFAWRYIGDFWPLVVLAVVQYVRFLPRAASPLLGIRLALVLGVVAYGSYEHIVPGSLPSVQTYDPAHIPGQWNEFLSWRDQVDEPLPARIACGNVPSWPFHNGEGWSSGCKVDTFTNVFLGVPVKADDAFRVRLRTDGIHASKLLVYVNGRTYEAAPDGEGYGVDVRIPQGRLASRAVMVTVQWVKALEPPTGTLLSIELV